MKSLLRQFFVAALLVAANGVAMADESVSSKTAQPEALHWRCWYDGDIHITCLIDTAPQANSGTKAEVSADLPLLVREMRANPGALKNNFVHIPLHTQPYDMEFTALLAKSVACGARANCTVDFSRRQPPLQEIVALIDKNSSDDALDTDSELARAAEPARHLAVAAALSRNAASKR